MSPSICARLEQRFGSAAGKPSRRDLLKGALAASGLFLGGCINPLRLLPSQSSAPRPRVIVVGAGLGGLACAYELDRLGYTVNVFEAQGRVGGRVRTLRAFVPGQRVEAGGEFIGMHHPTWAAYRDIFNLEFTVAAPDPDLSSPIFIDGQCLTSTQAQSLWEETRLVLDRLASDAAEVNADEPWQTAGAEKLDRRSAADWLAPLDVSPLCKQVMAIELQVNNCVPARRQSLLALFAQAKGGGLRYWPTTEWYRCEGGTQHMATRLARAVGEDRVSLNTPVVSILAKKHTLEVATAGGATYEADDVVLATPPGTWARIQIYPPLPDEMKPQMGPAIKYLTHVSMPFWLTHRLSPISIGNGAINATCRATRERAPWEGNVGDRAPWEMRGLDEGVALAALSCGAAAESISRLRPDQREPRFLAELEKLYPDFRRHRVASRIFDWTADRWATGGCAYPAPGEVTRIGPMLYEGRGHIHFAGEHCSWKYAGTMEGALSSGVSLAHRLAARDGLLNV